MKYTIQLCCLLLLISCGQKQATTFEDSLGRFKITFPEKPDTAQSTEQTQLGEITTYEFKVEPKDDMNLSYVVGYSDYPKSFVDTLSKAAIMQMIEETQAPLITSEHFVLSGTFNVKILGYPGKEFRWSIPESKKLLRFQIYMVENRMYSLAVTTEEENNFNIKIGEFFDSFELINTEQNPKEVVSTIQKEKIFRVDFPKPSEVQEREVTNEYGESKILFEMSQPKLNNDENIFYAGAHLFYPIDPSTTEGFDLETYYTGTVLQSLKGRQSSLISRKIINFQGVEGIETKESFRNGKAIITQRTFLKGKVQVSLQVMTVPEKDNNKSMQKFFDSFEWIED